MVCKQCREINIHSLTYIGTLKPAIRKAEGM